LPHHNPDFSAAYRGGMASDAREDVNLDDGGIAATGRLPIHRQSARQHAKFWEKIAGLGI
jgi:hypothetical protein